MLFLISGVSLLPYGDAYAQGQVVFFLAITVIGCIFCLMHVRPAALVVNDRRGCARCGGFGVRLDARLSSRWESIWALVSVAMV